MSDTERVRAWRQRLKDNGLVPMTIWVKAETKTRYEDLALQSHRSASEVAQLALDAVVLKILGVPSPLKSCRLAVYWRGQLRRCFQPQECLSLQRHFSVLTKFPPVESRFCSHKRRGKAAFDGRVNPCVKSICSRSVAVGL
jgi:hypothetical protein